jgi:hypothetical protein
MRRREFITLIGGVGAGLPSLTALAQEAGRVRRIGVLMNLGPMILRDRRASPRSCRVCRRKVGPSGATRRSTFAGAQATRSKCANRWRRW